MSKSLSAAPRWTDAGTDIAPNDDPLMDPLMAQDIGPVLAPDPELMARATKLIYNHHTLRGRNNRTDQELADHQRELQCLLTQLLNQIINLPQAPRLICKVEPSPTGSGNHQLNCYQDLFPPWEPDELMIGPKGEPIGLLHPTIMLAKYAMIYRQSFAEHQLTQVFNGNSPDLSATRINILLLGQLSLQHTALLLTDPRIMGNDFINHHRPRVAPGDPIHAWTRPEEHGSHITMTLPVPMTVAESLVGQPLTKLIELPDPAIIPPGVGVSQRTRDAFAVLTIDRLISHHETSIKLGLAPSVQAPRARHHLPCETGDTPQARQAITNLYRTAETI